MSQAWTTPIRLYELARGPVRVRLEPDEAERAALAKSLGLRSLPRLTADLTVRPWLDGAEISGRFDAVVEYVCSVTLEPFEAPVGGDVEVKVVPPGSAMAQAADGGGEGELDPDAPDPPDVLAGEAIDLAAYVAEHLALEIDPFPRRPGAEFEFTPPAEEESPFAVLKKLQDKKP